MERRLERREALAAELLRGGIGGLVMKVLSTALAFIVGVVLARALGPDQYGIYSYVFAIVSLLAVPAEFGLSHLVVRETARADAQRDWAAMRGVWIWASTATAVFSISIGLVAVCAIWFFRGNLSVTHIRTLAWGLILIPLMSLGKLRGAALRGLRYVALSQLPESVIRPALLVISVQCISYILPETKLTSDTTMMVHVLSSVAAFTLGGWLLWRSRPRELDTESAPKFESARWLRSALPLALLTSTQLVNKYADVLILGIFHSAEEVGVYNIVLQGATLVVFGQQVSNLVLAPQFARLHSLGDGRNLQRLIRVGAVTGLVTSLPVAVAFLTFGEQILTRLFGPEYAGGWKALSILAVGEVANATLGQVAHLLNMTGHERQTGKAFLVSALVNIGLNFLLIPRYGMSGAAFATSTSLLVWNCILWRYARNMGVAKSVI